MEQCYFLQWRKQMFDETKNVRFWVKHKNDMVKLTLTPEQILSYHDDYSCRSYDFFDGEVSFSLYSASYKNGIMSCSYYLAHASRLNDDGTLKLNYTSHSVNQGRVEKDTSNKSRVELMLN